MAHTALSDSEITEFFDDESILTRKVKELARLVRASKHFVIYTGAGISTSAGIPDFRGPKGVWTLKAKGLRPQARAHRGAIEPTAGHMAIVALQQSGYCKFLISTNCDGLHLKSGVQPHQLSELHGSSHIEACARCGTCYWR